MLGTLQGKRIVAVRKAGTLPTYNVTMRAPFHNYFANGILTANSHSVCYGILAYRSAWLKVHYPSHFWAAVLSSESNDSEKVGYYVSCARKQGVLVLRPDINLSEAHFVARGETIRFGLKAIRGIGESAVNAILQARKEKGDFHSMDDIIRRIDTRVVNRKVLENLVKAGACDGFAGHRAGRLAAVGILMEQNGKKMRERSVHKGKPSPGLFGEGEGETENRILQGHEDARWDSIQKWSEKELLVEEKKVLGVYLSQHPVTVFKEIIVRKGGEPLGSLYGRTTGSKVCIGGYVSQMTVKTTRRGQSFAVLQMEDETDETEVILWPDVFRRYEGCLKEGGVFLVNGQLEMRNRLPVRIVGKQVEALTMHQNQSLFSSSVMKTTSVTRQVVLHFNEDALSGEDMEKLRTVIYHHRGPFRLFFNMTLRDGTVVRLRAAAGFSVSDSQDFRNQIKQMFPLVHLTSENQG